MNFAAADHRDRQKRRRSEHQEDGGCMCALCMLERARRIVRGDRRLHRGRAARRRMGHGQSGAHRNRRRRRRVPAARSGAVFDGADHAQLLRPGPTLLDDETYEREQRRERSGFVTPQMAAVFLKTTRQAALDDLVAQTDYDADHATLLRPTAAAARQRQRVPNATGERRNRRRRTGRKRRSRRCSCAPWRPRWPRPRSSAIGNRNCWRVRRTRASRNARTAGASRPPADHARGSCSARGSAN